MDEIERNLREQEAIFRASEREQKRLQRLIATAPRGKIPLTKEQKRLKRLKATAPTKIKGNKNARSAKQNAYDLERCQSKHQRSKAKNRVKALANPWVKHVKAYAATNGISYKEALSKAKASYKKK